MMKHRRILNEIVPQNIFSIFQMIKYHEIPLKKFNKQEMNSLVRDVERSRIAVENITKFTSMEGKFKNQFNFLQEQLQCCITNITVETKKQKMLNELISIMKGEMFQYQATKKKAEQAEEIKKEKLVNKYQYEVDQILQKHNEQIAKIHNLKDLANSRRSERVVYSSLFKKLEKEIKHYEQIYKEQVMLSEYIKNSSYKTMPSDYKNTTLKQANDILDNLKPVQEIGFKQFIPQTNQPWDGFLTTEKHNSNKSSSSAAVQKKFYSTLDEDKFEIRSNYGKEEKFVHTKELLKQISEQNTLIERLKIHAECSSVEQLLEYYGTLEEQNKKLLSKILECDTKTDKIVKRTQEIRKKTHEEDLALCMFEDQDDKINKTQTEEQDKYQNSSIIEQCAKVVKNIEEIAKICNLELIKNQANAFSNQNLLSIYQKITSINRAFVKPFKKPSERQSTGCTQVVDCILDKMEKFSNCQRILDRGLLQQEYYKQMGRKKQIKSRKEASR